MKKDSSAHKTNKPIALALQYIHKIQECAFSEYPATAVLELKS
jgi:hypothetical protein